MPTEAQKKAIKKYDSEKIDQVRLRVPKGTKQLLQKCAEATGESVNALLNRLIVDEIDKVLKK